MDTTFVIQKVLWFLVLPPASILVLILVGLLAVNGRRLLGKSLIVLGVALLYLLSLGQVADLILKPLERPYPPLKEDKISADAVVVLGGGSVDLEWLGAGPVPNAETLYRLVTGVELAKKLRIPLVLSMGNGEPFSTKVNDADTMAKAAYAMGIQKNQLIVENTSRDTLENSREVRKLVKGNRIILSTSAYHMIRARAMFAKRGFTVTPAPSYYLAQTRKLTPISFIPRAADLARSATGIAEWMSLVWWGVRGEM
jgi:uncharacterized SAM-binding protein YcdF (DUF218 family)